MQLQVKSIGGQWAHYPPEQEKVSRMLKKPNWADWDTSYNAQEEGCKGHCTPLPEEFLLCMTGT